MLTFISFIFFFLKNEVFYYLPLFFFMGKETGLSKGT